MGVERRNTRFAARLKVAPQTSAESRDRSYTSYEFWIGNSPSITNGAVVDMRGFDSVKLRNQLLYDDCGVDCGID